MNIKYYKLKRQYSENGGVTWLDLGAYKVGDVVETNSSCETDDEQVLTREVQLSVDDAYTCDGYDKRYIISHQQSTDGGIIWTETHQTIGDVAEINSSDCGYDNSTSGDTTGTTGSCDLICTHYVTSIINKTVICSDIGASKISAMYIDDVPVRIVSAYTFETTGEHVVRLTLADCKRVGSSLLSGLTSLIDVIVPDGVKYIGTAAFVESSLRSVTIPSSVTVIGQEVFNRCHFFNKITCKATTAPYLDGSTSLHFSNVSDTGILIHPCGSDYSKWLDILNEPSSHNWTSECFEGSGDNTSGSTSGSTSGDVIAKYYIKDTVNQTKLLGNTDNISAMYIDGVEVPISTSYTFSTIGEHTVCYVLINKTQIPYFGFCSNLNSIEIPNSVTSIGDGAFEYCDGLTSIEIPNSVTSIGYSVFYACTSLTSITIPDSVISIGSDAFCYCDTLTSITIPYSVTSIGSNAFNYCTSLTSIEIPDSVTSIGNSAFYYCSGLTSIEIPSGVTSIGSQTFYQCYSLRSINIPSTVTSIGNYAFAYCSGLTSIEIPNSVTSIGDGAFKGCSKLTSITCYATTAPTIQSTTFYGIAKNGTLYYPCDSDYSSWLSHDIYYLGYYGWTSECFEGSGDNTSGSTSGSTSGDVIAKYYIKDTVNQTKLLGNTDNISAMYIDGVEVPISTSYTFSTTGEHTVEYVLIDKKATPYFAYCSNLTSIEIPNSVTSIGDGAFKGCSKLTSITCYATTAPTIKSSTFYRVNYGGPLYYPQGSDYSSWLSHDKYYLGYYGWTGQEI